jgi:hypothetical protein
LQHHGIPPKVRDPIAATAGPVLFTDKIAISVSTWRTSGSVCTSRGMPTSWSVWTVIGEPFEAPIGRRDASGKTTDMYTLIRCPNGCPPFKMLAESVAALRARAPHTRPRLILAGISRESVAGRRARAPHTRPRLILAGTSRESVAGRRARAPHTRPRLIPT